VLKQRKKGRASGEAAKLEMTPMIDVVFQLLIFFIVTLKQEDILAQMDVSRPAPDPESIPDEQPELLTVQVFNQGFIMNGRQMTKPQLESRLNRVAGYSTKTTVVIKCTADSPHRYLVDVLNVCSKAGLTNLSVFSM
jgi:biopolymer transport protein ExbD